MDNIETGLITFGTAIGLKDIIVKLLGPTAEYFGNEFMKFNKKRTENLKSIFVKANEKLDGKEEKTGVVPPVVIKDIIENGSLYSEDLFQEYYAGILCSARSNSGKDDIGKTFTQLVHRLSYYQLKAHYLIYDKIKKEYNGKENCGLLSVMEKLRVKFHSYEFNELLELNEEESTNSRNIVHHILAGLQREFLINPNWNMSSNPSGDYSFSVCPEINGYDLFLWGQGIGDISLDFLDKKLVFNDLIKK